MGLKTAEQNNFKNDICDWKSTENQNYPTKILHFNIQQEGIKERRIL